MFIYVSENKSGGKSGYNFEIPAFCHYAIFLECQRLIGSIIVVLGFTSISLQMFMVRRGDGFSQASETSILFS